MRTKKVIRKSPKKRSFCEKWFAKHLRVIRNITNHFRKVIRNITNHFHKVIRNYPKSDSYFAMRHRLFPALNSTVHWIHSGNTIYGYC